MRGGNTNGDQRILECVRHRDNPRSIARGMTDHVARQGVTRNQIDVATTRGDDDGLPQDLPQHHRGDPVWKEVMGIYEVEVTLSRCRRLSAGSERANKSAGAIVIPNLGGTTTKRGCATVRPERISASGTSEKCA